MSDAQVIRFFGVGGGIGVCVNENLLKSNFFFAQNSTSLLFEESRIQ